MGGVYLSSMLIRSGLESISGPTGLNYGGTSDWVELAVFPEGAPFSGGVLAYMDPSAMDVTEQCYSNIEIRFG